MTVQFHPILGVYFSACLSAMGMAVFSRRMTQVRGSGLFGVVMLFCAVWAAADGMEILVTGLAQKLVMVRISYLGVIGTTVSWSFFILYYSNNEQLLSPGLRTGLLVLPGIVYLAVLALHPSFYTQIQRVQINGLWGLSRQYGPLFWIWAVYAYSAVLGSGVLLAHAVLRFPRKFQGQIYLLLLAGFLPLISNFLYLTGHSLTGPFDPSAPAFVVSGVLVGYGFRRYRFLDVVPVAHDLVFRQVNSGVIVADNRGVILEMNPAAQEMTGIPGRQGIGETIQEAFSRYPSLVRACTQENADIEILAGDRVYEVRQTPMTDLAGTKAGQVILLYDITPLKQAQERLSLANERLRLMAITDSLTGVFNRGHFFDLSRVEMARAQREGYPFAIILVDLDGFKQVNDTLGHPLGDQVLRETAQCLRHFSREGDIIGRYGGDEFIVLAHGSDLAEAWVLAQRFCCRIPEALALLPGLDRPVTLSLGVAACEGKDPVPIDTLFEQADTALYQSKRGGRGRVSVWGAQPPGL